MSFFYPFLIFLQPGIFWPDLAEYRPLIVAAFVGLLIGLSRPSEYSRRIAFAHPIFVWLLIFIFAQVLSVRHGGLLTMLNEFSFWMVYPIFVAVSIILIPNAVALRRFVWGMIVGGMFLVVYGMYALYAGIGDAVSGRASAYGMYANSNDYTFIIIQILPYIYMYWRIEIGVIRRIFLGLSIVACGMGILLSLSRGGILALVLEATLIVLIGMKGKRRLILLPVLGLASAIAIGYQFSQREVNDAQNSNYTAQDSAAGRRELWRAGIAMFIDKPLLGVGSRQFGEQSRFYGDITRSHWGYPAHNTYVEILSGSGLVGFVAFALMSYNLLRELWRRPKKNVLPWLDATRTATLIAFCSIVFRAYFASKQTDWSFYTLCAIGLACCLLQRQINSSPTVAVDERPAPAAEKSQY